MRQANTTAAFVQHLRARLGTSAPTTPYEERDFAGHGGTAAFVRRLRAFGEAGA